MAENLVFKGKLISFYFDWFSLVVFLMWQFVIEVLVSGKIESGVVYVHTSYKPTTSLKHVTKRNGLFKQ